MSQAQLFGDGLRISNAEAGAGSCDGQASLRDRWQLRIAIPPRRTQRSRQSAAKRVHGRVAATVPGIRIRRERIASHLQKLRVDRLLSGDAVACEPSKILPDIIKYIPNDTHFLGEMIHGVGEPFDVLGTSWLGCQCSCGFRQWIEGLGRQSDTICDDRQTAKRLTIHGIVRC